jgi:hypothetical protein
MGEGKDLDQMTPAELRAHYLPDADWRAEELARRFKPCGHSALGCMNGVRPCCIDCDHGTYWRVLNTPKPDEETR